jgi:inosine/xanthosine triphosphate pyrophosphatase family protein
MESKSDKVRLTFITGNKKKLEEFLSIMSDEMSHIYDVTNKEIDCKSIFWIEYALM